MPNGNDFGKNELSTEKNLGICHHRPTKAPSNFIPGSKYALRGRAKRDFTSRYVRLSLDPEGILKGNGQYLIHFNCINELPLRMKASFNLLKFYRRNPF